MSIRGLASHSLAAAALVAATTMPALAVDWSGVAGQKLMVFYTGQASWEWILTQADHSGAKDMRQGKACGACHGDEQAKIGQLIASGERLEPSPPKRIEGAFPAEVKAAHDGERLHVRVSWPAKDGETVSAESMDPTHPTKVSMMLARSGLTEAKLGGCWGTCHDDLRHMASDTESLDLTKYIIASRKKVSRSGGGDSIKDQAALEALIDEHKFFEYWKARINEQGESNIVDGYILERRHVNENPVVTGDLKREGDRWVATMSRTLAAPSEIYLPINPGEEYMVGFAIHRGHADGRYHHVSLEQSLRLDGGDADIVAAKLP